MLKKILPGSVFFLFLLACNTPGKEETIKEMEAMKKADIAFSDLSQKKGMKAAFLEYMDTGVALLRPNHYPILGTDAQRFVKKQPDSFLLVWKPLRAEIAGSCDLGYTCGVYTYEDKDTSFQGTYATIWKKQDDGSWKFVLDTGNPGVDKQK